MPNNNGLAINKKTYFDFYRILQNRFITKFHLQLSLLNFEVHPLNALWCSRLQMITLYNRQNILMESDFGLCQFDHIIKSFTIRYWESH